MKKKYFLLSRALTVKFFAVNVKCGFFNSFVEATWKDFFTVIAIKVCDSGYTIIFYIDSPVVYLDK